MKKVIAALALLTAVVAAPLAANAVVFSDGSAVIIIADNGDGTATVII